MERPQGVPDVTWKPPRGGGSIRQQVECSGVSRAHHREVTVVKGGEFWLAETLDDRQHGGVDESDPLIGVVRYQRSNSVIVLGDHRLHRERPGFDVVQYAPHGLWPEVTREEVIQFDEDRGRYYAWLSGVGE